MEIVQDRDYPTKPPGASFLQQTERILKTERKVQTMSIMEMETKARELKELERMQEELTAEMEAIKDALKAAMGDQESVTAGAYKITWKPVTSSRLDTKALKAALPDIAARFTTSSTARRFTIN